MGDVEVDADEAYRPASRVAQDRAAAGHPADAAIAAQHAEFDVVGRGSGQGAADPGLDPRLVVGMHQGAERFHGAVEAARRQAAGGFQPLRPFDPAGGDVPVPEEHPRRPQGQPHLLGLLRQGCLGLIDFVPGFDVAGDLARHDEHGGDRSVGVRQRVDVIVPPGHPRTGPQHPRQAAARDRAAGAAGLGDPRQVAGRLRPGKQGRQGCTDDLRAGIEQPAARRVGVDDVPVRRHDHGHDGRRFLRDAAEQGVRQGRRSRCFEISRQSPVDLRSNVNPFRWLWPAHCAAVQP